MRSGRSSSAHTPVPAQTFYKMMLAPPCSGRAHWGKAGQPWADPCFDGAAHYPRWCDFGCAVQVRARAPERTLQTEKVK